MSGSQPAQNNVGASMKVHHNDQRAQASPCAKKTIVEHRGHVSTRRCSAAYMLY